MYDTYDNKVRFIDKEWFPKIINNNKIPILDIGERRGHTDYIDFICGDELTYPVMRGIDTHNRSFVVINVIINNQRLCQTFFQRYTDDKYSWMGSGGLVCTIGGMKQDVFEFITEIIEGKSPIMLESYNPKSESFKNKKVHLYQPEKINAVKIIERFWVKARHDPSYKFCQRIHKNKYNEAITLM